MSNDIAARTMADIERWQSQFSQDLLRRLEREVDGQGTPWHDIALLDVVEETIKDHQLMPVIPFTK